MVRLYPWIRVYSMTLGRRDNLALVFLYLGTFVTSAGDDMFPIYDDIYLPLFLCKGGAKIL